MLLRLAVVALATSISLHAYPLQESKRGSVTYIIDRHADAYKAALTACVLSGFKSQEVSIDSSDKKKIDKCLARWKEFKNEFKKVYVDGTDECIHLEAFSGNLVKIEKHNSQESSYTLGITPFADMTTAERDRMFGRVGGEKDGFKHSSGPGSRLNNA